MSVTNINSKAVQYAVDMLKSDQELDVTTKIPHQGGEHFIVGEKYEMYAPAAKGTADQLGIVWHDTEGWSFTYAGVIHIMDELYICTKDVHYQGKVIPEGVQGAFDALRQSLGGVSPLCPTYVALQLIRPVTD